jgi:hypothetical protein
MYKNKETQIKATQCSHLDVNYSHNTKHLANFLLRTMNLNTQLTQERKGVFYYVHCPRVYFPILHTSSSYILTMDINLL